VDEQQGVTVRNAFALLRALGRMQAPVGVTRLAAETGLAKTTAHRLLEQMAREDVVVRCNHRWTVGRGLRDLDRRSPDLGTVALPRLHALTRATGASVFLFTKSGDTFGAVSRSYGPLVTNLMPASEQNLGAEHPESALWLAMERGQLAAEYGMVHPDLSCIATPFTLPSGGIAVLNLASPSRRDVDALKPVLDRNAALLLTDMRRLQDA
jgi:IclR helix-turn-helix domain